MALLLWETVNGFRERIERIQARIREKSLTGWAIIRSICSNNPLTVCPSKNSQPI